MNKRKVIAISGSPGTGKSTIARLLAEEFDYKLLDLNEVIKEEEIYEEDSEGTRLVEQQELRNIFDRVLEDETGDIVIDGLLSHLLRGDQVTNIIVLRTNPEELENRLKRRGYSGSKLKENLDSEALGIILGEAIQEHGVSNIFEIDTTGITPAKVVEKFREALKGRENLKPGSVDWLEKYFEEKGFD